MPSTRYGSGQVTEVGAAEAMGGAWETEPGSAIAYGGQLDENSAPDSWGAPITQLSDLELTQQEPVALNGMAQGSRGPLQEWQEELLEIVPSGTGPDAPPQDLEVCPLTPAEWAAYKAQQLADADEAKRVKMIQMALAAGAGYVLARMMK
jgi:hypothetical protein